MNVHPNLLRNALRGNAIFSATTGVASIVAGSRIGTLMGVPEEVIIQNGISLLVFAAWLGWISTRTSVPVRQAAAAATLDTLWVVASLVVLAAGLGALTFEGKWIVGVGALVVATFADLQWLGLWKGRETARAQ